MSIDPGFFGQDMGMGISFFGLVILVLDIWSILNVVGSRTTATVKLLWILLIMILPFIGLIVWIVAGPRSARARA